MKDYRRKSTSKIDRELVIALLRARDGDSCAYCLRRMSFDGQPREESHHDARPSIEHLIPLNKGGENTPPNVVLVCRTCNLFMGDGSQIAPREEMIETLRNTRWVENSHGELSRKRVSSRAISRRERQRLRLS